MSDDSVPTTWTQAADRAVIGVCEVVALLFALPFGDALYHRDPILMWHWFFLTIGIVIALFGPFWPVIRRKFITGKVIRPPLEYLLSEDASLGAAIRDMAWCSAWAKWYAAQFLANNDHRPVSEHHLMHTAASVVREALLDGHISARGRLPGAMDYEPIPRERWRSSAPHMLYDETSGTLWRMILLPTGGATINPDGTVTGQDEPAVSRTAQLAVYDSIIIGARDFEKIWPRRDKLADSKRRKLLKKALKTGANFSEIAKLAGDMPWWWRSLHRWWSR